MQKIEDDPITMVTLTSTEPVPLPPHHRKVFSVAATPPKINRDVPNMTGILCDTGSSHPLRWITGADLPSDRCGVDKKIYNNQPLSDDRCGVSSNMSGGTHHAESRSGSEDEDKDVAAQGGAEEEEDAARTRRRGRGGEDEAVRGGEEEEEDVAARTRRTCPCETARTRRRGRGGKEDEEDVAARKRRMRRTWWREAARTYAKIKNHATINQWEWKGNEDEATRTREKIEKPYNN